MYDGENRANLYDDFSGVGQESAPPSIEESLAKGFGGDPVEWIPEAEEYKRLRDEALANGGMLASISPEPLNDGIFAGYHEIRILLFKLTDEKNPRGIERIAYATPEQFKRNDMRIPEEGLFALDAPEE